VSPPEQPLPLKNFVTYLPPFGRERLDRLLEEKKVEIITEPERDLARKMVLDWGRGPNLLNLTLGGKPEQYLEGGGGRRETTARRPPKWWMKR
jgi:hypothetical protein